MTKNILLNFITQSYLKVNRTSKIIDFFVNYPNKYYAEVKNIFLDRAHERSSMRDDCDDRNSKDWYYLIQVPILWPSAIRYVIIISVENIFISHWKCLKFISKYFISLAWLLKKNHKWANICNIEARGKKTLVWPARLFRNNAVESRN